MLNVIVPTDFSDNAKKAANYAMYLFDETAEVHLVYAYQIPHSGASVMISLGDILEKDAIDLLEKEQARLLAEFGGGKDRVKIAARCGQPETVIRKYARDSKAECIIMGTRGATGLKGILIGSVASSVLENSEIPVITIPEESDLGLPNNIAIAADREGLGGLKLPDKVVELAKFYNAGVHIVNVVNEDGAHENSPPEGAEHEPIKIADGLKHTYHFVENEDVEHGLETFLKDNPIDLLVLLNRKHDLVSRLFNRSMTKKMMLHSKTPMLAIPYFED